MIKSIREQSVLDKTYAKALPTAKSKMKNHMWGPPLGHGGMELRSTPPKAPKTINSNTSYLHLFIPQK